MAFNLLKNLDSDDIFISYSRGDGSAYLLGLDAALSARGFACFTDKRGTDADRLPPKTLFRKIKLCKTLVLLATPGALENPENIAPEVSEFAEANGTARIICVSFDRDAEFADWSKTPWYSYVVGKTREREDPNALKTGEPSRSVVEAIATASDYMKSKDRLRKYRNRAILILLSLVIVSSAAAGLAWYQLRRAAAATVKANVETARAEQATRDAAAALAQEQAAKAEAQTAKDEATKQKQLAKLASNEATEKAKLAGEAVRRAQAAETARRAAQAEADQQQTIASSRSLANRSQTLLRRSPGALLRSVTLAMDALKRSHTVEADSVLRESLALLPLHHGSRNYIGDILATALSPDASHFAVLMSNKNLRVYRVGDATPIKEIHYEEIDISHGCSIALSNNAAYAAVSSGKSIKVYDLNSGGSHTIQIKEESVTASKAALSPGGKYLALILEDGELEEGINKACVMEVESGRVINRIFDNIMYNDVSFSANGNLGIGARSFGALGDFSTGTALIWPLSTKLQGNESANKPEEKDFVDRQRFKQDNDIIAIAPGLDDTYFATDRVVWKQVPGGEFKPIARFPINEGDEAYYEIRPINHLAFTTNGKELVAVRDMPLPPGTVKESEGSYKEVELWDATEHLSAAHAYQSAEIQSVGFLPGDNFVAAVPALYSKENLRIFNSEGGAESISDVGRTNDGNKMFISPDARFVVTVSDNTAYVRDVWRSSIAKVGFERDLKSCEALTVSTGGEFLALAGTTMEGKGAMALIYARDGESYKESRRLRLGNDPPMTDTGRGTRTFPPIAVTSDGHHLVTLTFGVARVWDVFTAQDITPAALRELPNIDSVKLSDGGHYLAAIFDNEHQIDRPQTVLSLRLSDGGVVGRTSHEKRVNVVAFSPCEHYLITSGEDRVTFLIELSGGRVEQLRDDSPVMAAAFSSDERYFATGSRDGVLQVFATGETQTEITRLQDMSVITAIAFSKDGKFLATASQHPNLYDQDYEETFTLRVWLLRPGDLLAEANKRLASIPSYLRDAADPPKGSSKSK